MTEYPLPAANTGPDQITVGPDGKLWFTGGGLGCSCIGSISTSGDVATYAIPESSCQSYPYDIAAGTDGNLWFTDACSRVGYINPTTKAIGEYSVGGGGTGFIAAGPDGNLWFTIDGYPYNGYYIGAIGRITPVGTVTVFKLPNAYNASPYPGGITAGPDGKLWFTYAGGVGRITTSGAITEFDDSQSPGGENAITKGSDGKLWFTYAYGIGSVTTSGSFRLYSLNGRTIDDLSLDGIAEAPDGSFWMTDNGNSRLDRFDPALYSFARSARKEEWHQQPTPSKRLGFENTNLHIPSL